MQISHLLTFITLLALAAPLPEPVYTIHYIRSYRKDLVQNNFGCGKSIVYGTYLYPTGEVDALYALMNSHVYGFSANCNRPATYIKMFGDAQDYAQLIKADSNRLSSIAQIGTRNRASIIIDWKYMPEGQQREAAFNSLVDIVNHLKKSGQQPIVKAPASYFCAQVSGGKHFILDLPNSEFIIELHGQEAGKYTKYEQIFGESAETSEGYTAECPKYPTRPILNNIASDKKIHFEKTLDSTQSGFIGADWQKFLQQAGGSESTNIYFYDGYPQQTVTF